MVEYEGFKLYSTIDEIAKKINTGISVEDIISNPDAIEELVERYKVVIDEYLS